MVLFNLIQKSDAEVKFIMQECDVADANALRRSILSQVLNIAVDDNVHIAVNTSSMHNEFMSKRVTFIPLCFDEKEVEAAAETVRLYKFRADKKSKSISVEQFTTDDIEIVNVQTGEIMSREYHDKIFPDPILIARLKQGEHIKMEFTASVGTALDHCKFCPVSTCTYFNTLDEERVNKERKKVQPIDMNKFETLEKYRMFQVNELGEPCSFTFHIVSECRLSVQYIVDKALEMLHGKLGTIARNTTVAPIAENLYALLVKGEDHTLGNLIQVFCYNNYVRKNRIVDFIGYFQPHPLEKEIVFKVRFLQDMDNVPRFWDEALRLAAAHVQDVRTAFATAHAAARKKTSKKKTTQ